MMENGAVVKSLIRLSLVVALSALAPVPASAQQVEYYHLDALSSVRAVTDASGAVLVRHDYEPYGVERNEPVSTDTRRFTGKERDSESGLDYFGARYYGSRIGRFTTVDPVYTWRENLVDPQRWNRYAYARNNPLRYVDPDGRAITPETVWDLVSLGMSIDAVRQDPGSLWNWASLGADVLAVAAPVVPAVGMAIRGASKVDDAVDLAKGADRAGTALTKFDPEFAARQILGEAPVTPGGRSITPHAADRMVHGGPGRRPMSKAEVDQVLDQGDRIRKVDMTHPQGPTVTVQNTRMPGKPQVAVDAETGKRVITVIQPK